MPRPMEWLETMRLNTPIIENKRDVVIETIRIALTSSNPFPTDCLHVFAN